VGWKGVVCLEISLHVLGVGVGIYGLLTEGGWGE
jgi:hypothetical protein